MVKLAALQAKGIIGKSKGETHVNLWMGQRALQEQAQALIFNLKERAGKTGPERWRVIKGIENILASKGFDAAHVPVKQIDALGGDLVVFGGEDKVPKIKGCLKTDNVQLEFARALTLRMGDHACIFQTAWENRVRAELRRAGFIKVGTRVYVDSSEFVSPERTKHAYRVSPCIVHGRPSLWIDAGFRIMIPLKFQEAMRATEEESIKVRVLPDWKAAFVTGVSEKRVGESRNIDIALWRRRGVPVEADHRVVIVKFPGNPKPYHYPEICVYREFEYGRKGYAARRLTPDERVSRVLTLLNRLGKIRFLGFEVVFDTLPASSSAVTLGLGRFRSQRDFQVLLRKDGEDLPVNLLEVRDALYSGAQPYTGKVDGVFGVVAPPEVAGILEKALGKIADTYSKLNFGSLEQRFGIRYTEGRGVNDYVEAFNDMISTVTESESARKIIFVILPDVSYEGDIYYAAKDAFFNPAIPLPLRAVEPIQTQCLEVSTLRSIVNGNTRICETLAPQIYLKLYGRQAAIWLCKEPADSHIYDEPGITAYACFDTSRRKKYKSEISVFTAVTDPYGRFIWSDVIQSGGEGLTRASFYKLMEKIARVCKRYSELFPRIEPRLRFELRRIVLYKDGPIKPAERALMREVFEKGIPEDGLEPIPDAMRKRRDLPDSVSIDIVAVNKSPNRRVLVRTEEGWRNPRHGIFIIENPKSGILVSSVPHRWAGKELATVQPIQLVKVEHFNVDSDLEEPTIEGLVKEYFHLKYLNWLSLFQPPKFALPQRITQRTGEYISAQVRIPTGIIVW